MALYDQAGTLVAISTIGFEWSYDPKDGASDNFVFWRNLISWLAEQSISKLK